MKENKDFIHKKENASSPERVATDIFVLKFGGSCLLNGEGVLKIAEKVNLARCEGKPFLAVVSALNGTTNMLSDMIEQQNNGDSARVRETKNKIIQTHRAIIDELQLSNRNELYLSRRIREIFRELQNEYSCSTSEDTDRILSYGERLSSRIVSAALNQHGIAATPIESADMIVTCDTFGSAVPNDALSRPRVQNKLQPLFKSEIVPVVTGFIGSTHDGRVTTFGRNSSDYSAAYLAAVVGSSRVIFYKDVDGVYDSDPRENPNAKLLEQLCFEEFSTIPGSDRLLHPKAQSLLKEYEMIGEIRSVFSNSRGTRLS